MTKRALFAAAVTVVISAWVSPSLACSCAVPDVREARAAAMWVFEGVLLRSAGVGDPTAERSQGVFRVDRVWKGSLGPEVTIEIPAAQSMCPPHLEVGQRYVLYVSGTAPAPVVAACARYASGRQIPVERRRLGAPTSTAR